MQEKLGIFLSRMQPLHIGHLGMIDKALSENDKVLILIGSANKRQEKRNPIEIEIRKEILEETLKEKYDDKTLSRIKVKELPDWSTEDDIASNLEWGRYLYYNIVSSYGIKEFSMYFSDESDIIENWFQDKDIRRRIDLKLFERTNMFENVSSTKIRQAFIDGNTEYIEKNVPRAVLKRYELIRRIINESN